MVLSPKIHQNGVTVTQQKVARVLRGKKMLPASSLLFLLIVILAMLWAVQFCGRSPPLTSVAPPVLTASLPGPLHWAMLAVAG